MKEKTAYQKFVDFQRSTEPDDLPQDLVTEATDQEIGFWKRYQMTRAINNARAGKATPVELRLTGRKEILYPDTSKDLRAKARKKYPQKV